MFRVFILGTIYSSKTWRRWKQPKHFGFCTVLPPQTVHYWNYL